MSVKAVLFKSKKLKNGEHPIMIRYIKNRKAKYVSIGYTSSPQLWSDKENRPKKKHPFQKEINLRIDKKILEINRKISELDYEDRELSHHDFVKLAKRPGGRKSFMQYARELISKTRERGKIKTAEWYADGLKAITNMDSNLEHMTFTDLDEALMKRFYDYLSIKRKLKDTTISNYMRALSAIFGKAMDDGVISKREFPFSISKLKTETQKRAVNKQVIYEMIKLDLNGNADQEFARDIFLFSYFCRGMPFVDIANLTWSNIFDGRILYQRSKTTKALNILISEPIQKILEKYKAIQDDSGYIFPILSSFHDTPDKKENRRKKVLKKVNKGLKALSERLNLPFKLTTYVSRHTYASVMNRTGVNKSVIKQAMGHSRLQTTEIYLASFGNDELDEADKYLL